MTKLEIYCDGACRGNGKTNAVGAYGVVLQYGEHTKELYESFRGVTNNKMEIMAVIAGLKAVKRTNLVVEVYTDSAYVYNCITQKWYKKWMDNGWVTSSKTPVENRELWVELINELEKFPFIKFVKVKGHAGIPGNERADELCNLAMNALVQK